MQEWGPRYKNGPDTSLECASHPREGKVIQLGQSPHEARTLHHRSIVVGMGTSIDNRWQKSRDRFPIGSRYDLRPLKYVTMKGNETHSAILEHNATRLNGRPFGYRQELFDFSDEGRVFWNPAEIVLFRIMHMVIFSSVKRHD